MKYLLLLIPILGFALVTTADSANADTNSIAPILDISNYLNKGSSSRSPASTAVENEDPNLALNSGLEAGTTGNSLLKSKTRLGDTDTVFRPESLPTKKRPSSSDVNVNQ